MDKQRYARVSSPGYTYTAEPALYVRSPEGDIRHIPLRERGSFVPSAEDMVGLGCLCVCEQYPCHAVFISGDRFPREFFPISAPNTNGDRLRHMTDEELAVFLASFEHTNYCRDLPGCLADLEEDREIPLERCAGCMTAWLRGGYPKGGGPA